MKTLFITFILASILISNKLYANKLPKDFDDYLEWCKQAPKTKEIYLASFKTEFSAWKYKQRKLGEFGVSELNTKEGKIRFKITKVKNLYCVFKIKELEYNYTNYKLHKNKNYEISNSK